MAFDVHPTVIAEHFSVGVKRQRRVQAKRGLPAADLPDAAKPDVAAAQQGEEKDKGETESGFCGYDAQIQISVIGLCSGGKRKAAAFVGKVVAGNEGDIFERDRFPALYF